MAATKELLQMDLYGLLEIDEKASSKDVSDFASIICTNKLELGYISERIISILAMLAASSFKR